MRVPPRAASHKLSARVCGGGLGEAVGAPRGVNSEISSAVGSRNQLTAPSTKLRGVSVRLLSIDDSSSEDDDESEGDLYMMFASANLSRAHGRMHACMHETQTVKRTGVMRTVSCIEHSDHHEQRTSALGVAAVDG